MECDSYSKKLDNNITSFAIKDNIFGFQFHPEKSQRTGQELPMHPRLVFLVMI